MTDDDFFTITPRPANHQKGAIQKASVNAVIATIETGQAVTFATRQMAFRVRGVTYQRLRRDGKFNDYMVRMRDCTVWVEKRS